jgi:hypothetical protein
MNEEILKLKEEVEKICYVHLAADEILIIPENKIIEFFKNFENKENSELLIINSSRVNGFKLLNSNEINNEINSNEIYDRCERESEYNYRYEDYEYSCITTLTGQNIM